MILFALALLASDPAAAPAATAQPAVATTTPTAPAAKPTPVKVVDNSKKVICRDLETTGSRVSFRQECHTVAEWNQISDEARGYLNNGRANGMGENGGAFSEGTPTAGAK